MKTQSLAAGCSEGGRLFSVLQAGQGRATHRGADGSMFCKRVRGGGESSGGVLCRKGTSLFKGYANGF